jgi:putative transposase
LLTFGSLEDARAWVRSFFDWYSQEHYHSFLGLLTPASVHDGLATEQLELRQRVLDDAFCAHPERFVRKLPSVQPLPEDVWINRLQPVLEVGEGSSFGVKIFRKSVSNPLTHSKLSLAGRCEIASHQSILFTGFSDGFSNHPK